MNPHTLTPRALELARQRLDQALEERPDDVQLLLLRARTDERRGRHAQAAEYFQRAAHVARRGEDRACEGEAQLDRGTALSRGGMDGEAIEAYGRAITCFDLVGDEPRAIEARKALVRHELAHRRFDAARQQLKRMLPRVQACDDGATLRWAHDQLVHLHRRADDLTSALEHARTCVRLAAHAHDPAEFGRHLRDLATLHDDLGHRSKALAYLRKALPYLRESPRRSPVHTTLLRLSELTDDRAEAVRCLEEAVDVAERGSPRDRGQARVRLASLLMEDDPERARSLLNEAVSLLRAAGDPKLSAPAWLKLAVLQARLGDSDEARVSQRRARELFSMVGDSDGADRAARLLDLL